MINAFPPVLGWVKEIFFAGENIWEGMWEQSKGIKAQVTDFQRTDLNHECIFSVWLRSHTTCLKTHWTCVAQPFTLQNPWPGSPLSSSRRPLADVEIKAEGLATETRSSLVLAPALSLPRKDRSFLSAACPWRLELATGTHTWTCPPCSPVTFVLHSLPSRLHPTPRGKCHSASGQVEVCKGERDCK